MDISWATGVAIAQNEPDQPMDDFISPARLPIFPRFAVGASARLCIDNTVRASDLFGYVALTIKAWRWARAAGGGEGVQESKFVSLDFPHGDDEAAKQPESDTVMGHGLRIPEGSAARHIVLNVIP